MRPLAHWQRARRLADLTTWQIGGPARFFSSPVDLTQLRQDLATAQAAGLPVLIIGGGSNLLCSDAGYPGLVLRLPSQAGQAGDSALVHLAAGMPLATAARQLAAAGRAGLEWAAGIPGTIGGAIVNNAGAHGGCMADTLSTVELLLPDGSLAERDAAHLELAYRSSALKGRDPTRECILGARFRLSAADPGRLLREVARFSAERSGRFPAQPSCGCVFRNPPGMAAGRLIDELGLGGLRCGQAQVSPRHANFIVNLGGALAGDVLAAIRAVRSKVLAATGTRLELEVQLVGFAPGEADY